jgi:hypothetical protein
VQSPPTTEDTRRYLVIAPVVNGIPGKPVQIQAGN